MRRKQVRLEPLKAVQDKVCFYLNFTDMTEPFSAQATTDERTVSDVNYGQECHGHLEHQRPRHGVVLGTSTPPIEYGVALGLAFSSLGCSSYCSFLLCPWGVSLAHAE